MKKKKMKRKIGELKASLEISDFVLHGIEAEHNQLKEAVSQVVSELFSIKENQMRHIRMVKKHRQEWPELWESIDVLIEVYRKQP